MPHDSLSARIQTLQLRHAWTISRGSAAFKENVFVRLQRDGLTGFGEAAPNARYGETPASALQAIGEQDEFLKGQDWFHFHSLAAELGRRIPQQAAARCALDMAILDWCGKQMGQPVHRLCGLDPSAVPPTSYSIGIDRPEVMQEKVREASEFQVFKIKLGHPRDREMVEAIRAVTDRPLRVDANEGWTSREEALERISWLRELNVELIEQPLPADRLEDAAWLRERAGLPLIADESALTPADLPDLRGCYDGVNIKLMKAGGIQEALRMIQTARSLGLRVMLGCMIESSNAIAAAAQLAPLADWVDLDGHLLLARDPFDGLQLRDGKVLVSQAPGLGVAPAL